MLKHLQFKKPEDEYNDLGLGTKISKQRERVLNKDGSFNVGRTGNTIAYRLNFYHEIIHMKWPKFLLYIVLLYITVNTLFAFLYMAIGIEQLTVDAVDMYDKFWNAFFFSGQALTTVGFGRISPQGWGASILATIESVFGLLGFAVITGSLYARLSRPTAKIIYSHYAVIAPYKNINGLMFRMINGTKSQLIDLEMQVMYSRLEEKDGEPFRRYYDLTLERKRVNFFPLSWTIVHPIDENSPLYGIKKEDLKESDVEILILLKAFDETFSQTVNSRSSYSYPEILWGAKFTNMFIDSPDGKTTVDVNLLSSVTESTLN